MARIVEFRIEVELEDEAEVSLSELEDMLAELEYVCARRNYGLYDAGIYEDGECLTDAGTFDTESDTASEHSYQQEHQDFAQDDGYDGILGEG